MKKKKTKNEKKQNFHENGFKWRYRLHARIYDYIVLSHLFNTITLFSIKSAFHAYTQHYSSFFLYGAAKKKPQQNNFKKTIIQKKIKKNKNQTLNKNTKIIKQTFGASGETSFRTFRVKIWRKTLLPVLLWCNSRKSFDTPTKVFKSTNNPFSENWIIDII